MICVSEVDYDPSELDDDYTLTDFQTKLKLVQKQFPNLTVDQQINITGEIQSNEIAQNSLKAAKSLRLLYDDLFKELR